jgi:hypothetical protein
MADAEIAGRRSRSRHRPFSTWRAGVTGECSVRQAWVGRPGSADPRAPSDGGHVVTSSPRHHEGQRTTPLPRHQHVEGRT